jgi:hypothetical protein
MRMRIAASLLLFISLPLWAQDSLYLEHQVVGVEQTATMTRLTYQLTLTNHSNHQFHSLRLKAEDVALSLSSEAPSVEFHTLAPGSSKQRFLTVMSTLNPQELQQPRLLLFHLQGQDESGNTVSHLLRSVEVQP